ncbi:MAG: hypothetical protein M3O34_20150 [Chloroflexota bacterium]|nr:hypothetical protein [Chloroflexota bacterium]
MSSLAPSRSVPLLARLGGRLELGRHRGLILAGLLFVGLAPPAYLLQTGNALSTGYTIQRLQAERTQWIVKNEQLTAEIARARSLAWVESEAVNRLRMQRSAEQILVRVDVPPPSAISSGASAGARVRAESAQPAVTPAWTNPVGAVLANLLAGR